MIKRIKQIFAVLLIVAYCYDYMLCVWGKQVIGIHNIQYLVALHVLAFLNYLTFAVIKQMIAPEHNANDRPLVFLLHGLLLSVLPYSGYLLMGSIMAAASLLALSIQKNK